MSDFLEKKRILCLFREDHQFDSWIDYLSSNHYFVYQYPDLLSAMAQIYNDPPDIILLSTQTEGWENFLKQMKNDAVYGHLILMLIVERNDFHSLIPLITGLPLDDLVMQDTELEEVLLRVRMKEILGNRYLDANPLTRLPGNYSIMSSIQNFINSRIDFGLTYLDIDNFKAFNDKYGFARGDDMIRMTARILTNVIKRLCPEKGFIGHIGGDDFVFIVFAEVAEECCKQVIQNFDLVSSTLSDDEDRLRGFIETEDRQGKNQKFPLPTVSLSVIDTRQTQIFHPGEASAISSELKKVVKKMPGSNYMINRRSYRKPGNSNLSTE